MSDLRDHLTQNQKAYYQEQKQGWFLDGVDIYCDAIESLAAALAASDLRGRMSAFVQVFGRRQRRSNHVLR